MSASPSALTNIYNVMDASKERNFLNKLDVNVNMAYTRVKSTGIDANSIYGSILAVRSIWRLHWLLR